MSDEVTATYRDAVDIYHAQPSYSPPVTPVVIRIEQEIPDFGSAEGYAERAQATYADQGRLLADALYGSLPGGTLDALLAELLERRASMLRVRFGSGRG